MSYTISLSIDVADDIETGTLNDDTVYTSPVRSSVRVFATGYKYSSDDSIDETLTMTSDTGSATTVTSWEFNYPKDGWFRYLFVIIKSAYSSGTTYALYDSVYDGSNNVYRSKQAGNIGNSLGNTTYWEPITDPSQLALNKGESNESLNIESLVYERVLTSNSQYEYGNFLAEDGSACCGDCNDIETVQDYKKLSLLVNSAIQCDVRSLVVEGEKICRKLQSLFDC